MTKQPFELVPISDRILVLQDAAPTASDKGIIIPDEAQEKPLEGRVIALGRGRFNEHTGTYEPFTVDVGARVLFSAYAGSKIKWDDVEYLCMREEDLLCKVLR